jgi:hypothetical protein
MADLINSVPEPGHPYFPLDAVIPGYLPNSTGVFELIATFGAIVSAVIGFAVWQTTRTRKPVRPIDQFAVGWFALCKSDTRCIQTKQEINTDWPLKIRRFLTCGF